MAIWWLNVANELAALRKAGTNRPEAHLPDMFSEKAPAIETSYRVVPIKREAPPAPVVVLPVVEPPRRPERRFHSEGHLFNTGRGESSFLAEGRRRKNRSGS